MGRKYAAEVHCGDVLDELGPKLVVDTADSWDGGVMLTWLDLHSGEKDTSFFSPWDHVDEL